MATNPNQQVVTTHLASRIPKEEMRLVPYNNGMRPITYSDFEALGRENNCSDEIIKRDWLRYQLVDEPNCELEW